MCGIVGILNLQSQSRPIEESILTKMRDTMVHRGPDSSGIWISKDRCAAFGHRRLKIVDLSEAARQPMTNEDGTIWITFNGEIYNHAKLRSELEKAGHVFKSQSDTEVIIHGYEQWGNSVVKKLHGMFVFALWDEKKSELFIARDRLGKKPFYFSEVDNQFVFASEIKAILEHPKISKSVNEEALWHYLTFAVTPAPLTLFQNIYKLPPATHLTISKTFEWSFVEYWQPWAPTDNTRSFDDYAEELKIELQAAVNRRLMSDVPFGVFLSGGVDSSANVAFMSQAMDRPVDTFSVGFEDKAQEPYNEIQYARQISKLFKTNHHEVLISDKHFFEFVDKLAYHQDEPLSDPVCFPLYYVSKLARSNGTIVVQVGEGSDEIFAGYDIYRNYLKRSETYWRKFQLMPKPVRKMAVPAAKLFLKKREAVHFKRAAEGEPAFLSAALAFYDSEKSKLRMWQSFEKSADLTTSAYKGLNPSFEFLKRLCPKAKITALPNPFKRGDDQLKKMIFWECHHRLGELLLMRLDKMTMANSIEGRAPFLDTDVVELAMKIPSGFKIQDGTGKAVLKKALERDLPQELIYRKKIGFCGGSGNMLTPQILKFAREQVMKTLPSQGWKTEQLEKLFDRHGIKSENSFQIWNLMNLSLWFKRWMS